MLKAVYTCSLYMVFHALFSTKSYHFPNFLLHGGSQLKGKLSLIISKRSDRSVPFLIFKISVLYEAAAKFTMAPCFSRSFIQEDLSW